MIWLILIPLVAAALVGWNAIDKLDEITEEKSSNTWWRDHYSEHKNEKP